MELLTRILNALNFDGILRQFLQVVPVALLTALVYALLRRRRLGHGFSLRRELPRLLFVCYLAGLWALVLTPANFWDWFWSNPFTGDNGVTLHFFCGEYNFVPILWKLLRGQLTVGRWVAKMLLYNFLMFVPFGFFLPFVTERVTGRKVWLVALGAPLVIELLQPIVGRSCDIDDWLLNAAGILAGYALARLSRRIRQNKQTNQAPSA